MSRSMGLVVMVAWLVCCTYQITKYDFNVCRIKFCADKEAACVSDQSACMDAFAKTRTCFLSCTSADQLETYNKCWTTCKQSNAYYLNALYYSLSQCYESVCYLSGHIFQIMSLALLLIIFMFL